MTGVLNLYSNIILILNIHQNWLDIRHMKTFAWMIVGVIESKTISLTQWAIYVEGDALAQSKVRRFRRWLENDRIKVHDLYKPLIVQALSEWGQNKLYLALDTSMMWGDYCLIRLAIVYRGRAIPLVWKVIKHSSSTVALADYKDLIRKAVMLLLPFDCQVVFLADRGFADTELMEFLNKVGWGWRIRLKRNFKIYRCGKPAIKAGAITPKKGHAIHWQNVSITAAQFGPVHLAFANPLHSKETWLIVSNEPTDDTVFDEYGLRFSIEENFLDDKSNGFQLESSLIRDADSLSRLCFVLAVTTLYLVSQGVEVVDNGQRQIVDPHWFRGSSYLKIGWAWVRRIVSLGGHLISRLHLSPNPDPDPSIASLQQNPPRQITTSHSFNFAPLFVCSLD